MQAAKEFEEKVANPIADATQEASGLNAEQINRCSSPRVLACRAQLVAFRSSFAIRS
jgi:hypothetical protein